MCVFKCKDSTLLKSLISFLKTSKRQLTKKIWTLYFYSASLRFKCKDPMNKFPSKISFHLSKPCYSVRRTEKQQNDKKIWTTCFFSVSQSVRCHSNVSTLKKFDFISQNRVPQRNCEKNNILPQF